MIDTSMYGRIGGFDQGLRMGQAIGGVFTTARNTGLRDQALERIKAGEDYNAVVQEVMQQSPEIAQELINLRAANMKAQSDQLGIQQTEQQIRIGNENLSRAKLQQSAMPMLGALMVDNADARKKLLEEAAQPFKESNPAVFETIVSIGRQPEEVQANAISGIIKTLRQAGVYPDDPSQMIGQGTALSQNLALLDQAKEAGDTERAELIRRNIDPSERAISQAEADLQRQQALNPILAGRKAGEVQAVEQTATGSANLEQQQIKAQQMRSDQEAKKREKDSAVATINQQLQQIDLLAKHPGFERAVGFSSYAPVFRGTDAADFNAQLAKFDAQSFMAMIPNMTGMGALSNAEGQRVTAALSALTTGMSEKGFQQELNTIKENMELAKERIRTGKLLSLEESGPRQRSEQDILAEYGL